MAFSKTQPPASLVLRKAEADRLTQDTSPSLSGRGWVLRARPLHASFFWQSLSRLLLHGDAGKKIRDSAHVDRETPKVLKKSLPALTQARVRLAVNQRVAVGSVGGRAVGVAVRVVASFPIPIDRQPKRSGQAICTIK